MQTKVSTKGQVVLPGPVRRRLGIRAGDPLDVCVEAGSIILKPRRKRAGRSRIITDPVTGLPVLYVGSDTPVLTTKHVAEILANFP